MDRLLDEVRGTLDGVRSYLAGRDEPSVLVVQGTARDGRQSIHAARYATERFETHGVEAELYDLKAYDVPSMETPRYHDGDHPDSVETFGRMVEDADGLVLVAPEYNHSYPGALKNLLDYLYPEYDGKPFAYITVSAGGHGGVRAEDDMKELTLALGGEPGPSLSVSNVRDVFDGDGGLQDASYAERFDDWVEAVVEHAGAGA